MLTTQQIDAARKCVERLRELESSGASVQFWDRVPLHSLSEELRCGFGDHLDAAYPFFEGPASELRPSYVHFGDGESPWTTDADRASATAVAADLLDALAIAV